MLDSFSCELVAVTSTVQRRELVMHVCVTGKGHFYSSEAGGGSRGLLVHPRPTEETLHHHGSGGASKSSETPRARYAFFSASLGGGSCLRLASRLAASSIAFWCESSACVLGVTMSTMLLFELKMPSGLSQITMSACSTLWTSSGVVDSSLKGLSRSSITTTLV